MNIPFKFFQTPAMAEETRKFELPNFQDFTQPDVIEAMMKQEFTADLKDVPFEEKV